MVTQYKPDNQEQSPTSPILGRLQMMWWRCNVIATQVHYLMFVIRKRRVYTHEDGV